MCVLTQTKCFRNFVILGKIVGMSNIDPIAVSVIAIVHPLTSSKKCPSSFFWGGGVAPLYNNNNNNNRKIISFPH